MRAGHARFQKQRTADGEDALFARLELVGIDGDEIFVEIEAPICGRKIPGSILRGRFPGGLACLPNVTGLRVASPIRQRQG